MDPDRKSVIYGIRRHFRKGQSEDLFKNFLTLGGYSTLAAIITFGLHLAMARLLGPEQYAAFGTYVAILFTVFFALTSIHLIITRFVSYHRSRYQYEQINYIITRAIKWVFIAGLITFVLTVLLADEISLFFHLESITPTVVLGFVMWFTLFVPVFEGAFKGMEHFQGLGVYRILEAALRLVFVVLAVWLGFEVSGALFGLGLGTFLALALTYKHIYNLQHLKAVQPDTKKIRQFAVPVAITMSSLALLLNIDLILVKHFFDPATAGVFAAASLIAKVPFLVAMVFVGVMFPKITRLHADGKDTGDVLKNALQVIVPLVAVFTLVSFFAADPVFLVLFGSAYTIGPVLGFYVFGMGALAVALILYVYMLAIRKDSVAFSLPLFLILLGALLVWLHSSLLQVMIIVMLVMTALAAFAVYEARNEVEFDYFL